MIAPPPPRVEPALDPEALIREARERQRRRRLRLAALALVLVAAAGIAYGVARGDGDGSALVRVPAGPLVDADAFAGHGRLAFVSRGTLWVLDGSKLRRVPTPAAGFVPVHPVFSHDGRRLAWLERRTSPVTGESVDRLWLARGDGSGAHVVPGLRPEALFGWSPTADLLAVSAGPERTTQPCPCSSPTTLRLLSPDGSSRVLARGPDVSGAAWSPDGRALAVGIWAGGNTSRLATYPVGGGAPTVWLRFAPHTRLNGMNGILLEPAGWWRGFGIGFWAYGDGMVHNNDQTPLDVVAAPAARPRLLAQTLSDGTTRVAAGGDGRLAVVADVSHGVNGGRVVWSRKQVELCTPAAGCRQLVHRAGKVSADPAWSPDGRTLAFEVAPDWTFAGWPWPRLSRWYAQHRLLLADAASGRLRALPAAAGATVPFWSPDGKSLLYVARNGLWLLPSLDAEPVEIARPLFRPGHWPAYYGQVAWERQFAWWSR